MLTMSCTLVIQSKLKLLESMKKARLNCLIRNLKKTWRLRRKTKTDRGDRGNRPYNNRGGSSRYNGGNRVF